jgi:hypothetical protein
MPTEQLENALRSVLARAAADIQAPEQERQRLLQRNYRPGRRRRRLAAGITATTAAAAVMAGLGLTGSFGSVPARGAGAIRTGAVAPARGMGTIRTAAFTLVKHANGTATLTINSGVILEPGILQRDLQQEGIPAIVETGSFCSSDPSPAGFNQVVTGQKHSGTMTINPAAMPAGTELSFGYFRLSPGQETAMGLIDASSYTCASAVPTTPPSGSAAMVVRITGSKTPANLP